MVESQVGIGCFDARVVCIDRVRAGNRFVRRTDR